MISQTAGRSAVTVTSGAAVPMLSSGTTGVSIPNAFSWSLTITTDQDVAVKVYASVGANCGLVLVSGWSATATSAAPYTLSVSAQPYERVYVTAQASSTTATVNCDFRAQSSTVN